MAFRTFFGGCIAAVSRLLFDGDLINWSVAFDVATKIEDQAIALGFMQSEPSPNHLNKQTWRHGWTEQRDAIDVRCIEAGRQDVDVAEILEWLTTEQCSRRIASKPSQQLFPF